jgi:uncharacterized protein
MKNEKRIFITGCDSGLGICLLKELISKNCFVLPHCKNYPFIKYDMNYVIGNINEKEVIDVIEKRIREDNINILINNAGIYLNKELIDCSDNEIVEVINTDLIAQILITKRIYKYFKEKNCGLIININSLAGKQPSANESIYCAAKFGLSGFSNSLQIENKNTKIQIKDFYIGAMKTKMTTNRIDYNSLIDPNYIANYICNEIMNDNINCSEYVIRRQN